MRKLLLFLIIFMALTGISCIKDSPPDVHVPLPPEFLSYFNFPQGSWWVYKEIKSGKTDSFYLDKFVIEKADNQYGDHLYYQYFSYHFTGQSYSIHGTGQHLPDDPNSKEFYYSESFDESYQPRSVFVYPSTIGGTGNILFKISSHFDSLAIQGYVYKDVYVTADSNVYNNPLKSEYYCKNVGIIRREFFDSTVWELTKYHLNK